MLCQLTFYGSWLYNTNTFLWAIPSSGTTIDLQIYTDIWKGKVHSLANYINLKRTHRRWPNASRIRFLPRHACIPSISVDGHYWPITDQRYRCVQKLLRWILHQCDWLSLCWIHDPHIDVDRSPPQVTPYKNKRQPLWQNKKAASPPEWLNEWMNLSQIVAIDLHSGLSRGLTCLPSSSQ